MQEYGLRFAMVKRAAEARDWSMAGYQLDKAIDIQKVGETTRPERAAMLQSFERSYLEPWGRAIQAKDSLAFDALYRQAIDRCNECHQATGYPYLHVRITQISPEPFLSLEASEPATHD
jgi:hypothetical protein